MTTNIVRKLLVVLVLALLALPALAELGPEGRELRVNQRTDFRQRNPAVAFAPSGRALAVWENDQRGLRGQFFAVSGQPAGGELTLVANQALAGLPAEGTVISRREPALVFVSENELALAWTEETAYVRTAIFIEDRQVLDQDIVVQRFNAAGLPVGERIRVNTAEKGREANPRLIANGQGLLVVWDDAAGGVFGRFLGPKATGVFRLNADETIGTLPAVVKGANNRYLAVWQGNDGSESGIFARLFDSTGAGIGSELRVNTNTVGRQRRHSVAPGADGSFFVVWQHDVSRIESHLFAQQIGRAGNFVGGEIALGVDPDEDHLIQMAPSVVSTGPDRFLVTWMTFLSPWSGVLIAGREVDANGTHLGEMFLVSERQIERNFRRTAIAADSRGGFLAAWETVAKGRVGIGARRLGE
jgi:hypothetical protein